MSRIKRNFYMIDGYEFQRITKADRAEMSDEEVEYWKDKEYWYVHRSLPNGRLFAGWSFQHPTKLTREDLPEDYIPLLNYKKHGYIRTSGIVSLIYHQSTFHNHAFKDDFLYISYTKNLGEYRGGYDEDSTFKECDEYIFGNDIVDFVLAAEVNSPYLDVTKIKQDLVDQYNAYCDERNEIGRNNLLGEPYEKIKRLEELRP